MTTPPGTPFARPSGPGDKFDNHDHIGRLLVIYPKSYDPSKTTSKGVNACADADIIVVDSVGPDGKPLVFHDAKIFGNLASSVRDSVGSKVLGRLGQVPTASGNLAWVLQDWTDAEAAQAGPVSAAFEAGQFAKPTQQQQAPPGHDPWAGTNATPAPPQQQAWGQQPPAPAAPAQQQWAPPPAQQQWTPPPAAAPAPEDPNIAILVAQGCPEDQARAMDPQTRANIAATYKTG